MSDEEIIKRKLLIDGDGTGDDRRLNVISKTLNKWINSPLSSDPASLVDNQTTQDKLLAQLSLCEYSVKRSQLLTKTTTKQLDNYQKIQKGFEQQIIDVKKSIEQSKENLVQAKIWKQNHMMYDLLAQSIQEQPGRKETNERLLNLQTELRDLYKEKDVLEEKLDQRRKQFHVLVTSASKLEQMLEESEFESSLADDEALNNNTSGPEPMSE